MVFPLLRTLFCNRCVTIQGIIFLIWPLFNSYSIRMLIGHLEYSLPFFAEREKLCLPACLPACFPRVSSKAARYIFSALVRQCRQVWVTPCIKVWSLIWKIILSFKGSVRLEIWPSNTQPVVQIDQCTNTTICNMLDACTQDFMYPTTSYGDWVIGPIGKWIFVLGFQGQEVLDTCVKYDAYCSICASTTVLPL